jgi:hypothetical protein
LLESGLSGAFYIELEHENRQAGRNSRPHDLARVPRLGRSFHRQLPSGRGPNRIQAADRRRTFVKKPLRTVSLAQCCSA